MLVMLARYTIRVQTAIYGDIAVYISLFHSRAHISEHY